jgi:hypothetical protein
VDEVKETWKKLHNEELNDLYSAPNVVQMMKSRRLRWAGHVGGMGGSRGVCRVLVGNLREKDHLEDIGIDGGIILRSIIWKWDVGAWTRSIWVQNWTGGGHF